MRTLTAPNINKWTVGLSCSRVKQVNENSLKHQGEENFPNELQGIWGILGRTG